MIHRAHHEGEARRFLLGRFKQRAMVGTDQTQIIGAPALHVAQIIGVIDDAGEVGVLVIDAHGKEVAAVADFAVKRDTGHRFISTAPVPSSRAPNSWPSKRLHRERCDIDAVEAANVDVDLVRVRARHVERMNAAGGAEGVPRRAGVEPVSGQGIGAAQKFELLRRDDQMQQAFLGADRTIAVGDARKIRGDAKPHPAAMTTA